MYTEAEILKILETPDNLDLLEVICDLFLWLIKQGELERSAFLKKAMNDAFVRISDGLDLPMVDSCYNSYQDIMNHINSSLLWNIK